MGSDFGGSSCLSDMMSVGTAGGWGGGGYASPSVFDFTSAPIARTCEDPFYGTRMNIGSVGPKGKAKRNQSPGTCGGLGTTMHSPGCGWESSLRNTHITNTQVKKRIVESSESEAHKVTRYEYEDAKSDDDSVAKEAHSDDDKIVIEQVCDNSSFADEYESSVGPWDDVGGIAEIYEGPRSRRSSLVSGLKTGRSKARWKRASLPDIKYDTEKNPSKRPFGLRNLREANDLAADIDINAKRPKTDPVVKSRRNMFLRGKRASLMGPPPLLRQKAPTSTPSKSQAVPKTNERQYAPSRELSTGSTRPPFFSNGSPVTTASSRDSSSCVSVGKEVFFTRRRSSASRQSKQGAEQDISAAKPPLYGDVSQRKRKISNSSRDSKSSNESKSGSKLSLSFLSLINSRRSSEAAPPSPYWDEDNDDASMVEPGTGLSDWKPTDYADDDYVVFIQENGSPLKPRRPSYIHRLVKGNIS